MARQLAAAVLVPFVLSAHAASAQTTTAAGTQIVNVAGLRFEEAGRRERVTSNPVTLTVGEVLDVAIVTPSDRITVARGDGDIAAPFTVTNLGNAAETFAIAARTDRPGATIVGTAADTNDDGIYDPAADQALVHAEIVLQPGQGRRVFVLVRGAASDAEATTVTATATAATGHGEPGAAYPGAGAGGGDAVVGRTGAVASASTRAIPGAATPSLTKSQSVVAPDGTSQVVAGSVVTYRLDARFDGPTAAVEIVDPIPVGTRFVAGSIRIDGNAASDAGDDDPATFDGSVVRAALGDIAAASTRSIQFDVQVQ